MIVPPQLPVLLPPQLPVLLPPQLPGRRYLDRCASLAVQCRHRASNQQQVSNRITTGGHRCKCSARSPLVMTREHQPNQLSEALTAVLWNAHLDPVAINSVGAAAAAVDTQLESLFKSAQNVINRRPLSHLTLPVVVCHLTLLGALALRLASCRLLPSCTASGTGTDRCAVPLMGCLAELERDGGFSGAAG